MPNPYIRAMRARVHREAETVETATVEEAVHWRFSNVPGLHVDKMNRLLDIRVDAVRHPTQVDLARLRGEIAQRDAEHAMFLATLPKNDARPMRVAIRFVERAVGRLKGGGCDAE